MVLVRPRLGRIQRELLAQAEAVSRRGQTAFGGSLVGLDGRGSRHDQHFLRSQAIPGDDVVSTPRTHDGHDGGSLTELPVDSLAPGDLAPGEELWQMKVLEVLRSEDGRDGRAEADLHGKVEDVCPGPLDRAVGLGQAPRRGQAGPNCAADRGRNGRLDGLPEPSLQAAPPAWCGRRSPRQQQRARPERERLQPRRVTRVDQEEVPLVAVVEAGEGAGHADDHLFDAATFPADQASVDAYTER